MYILHIAVNHWSKMIKFHTYMGDEELHIDARLITVLPALLFVSYLTCTLYYP